MTGITSDQVRAVVAEMAGTVDDWRLRRPARPSAPRFGANWIGPVMAIGSTLVGGFAFTDTLGDDGVGFALFIGSVSIMLMAWSNLLSTRMIVLEQLFGGVDRMYRWHRWFGALAVAAMWLHTQTVDDVKGIAGASRDVAEAAEDLASTGTNIIYALVGISLLRWIPYRWWRLSHKFLGVPFAFACWHFYTATKPYANDSWWGRWFTGFMLLGLAAWLHRVVWRDMIRRGRRYRVTLMRRAGDTVTIELEPVGRGIHYQPGQFAFIKVQARGLSEPHPFTIASTPGESVLRFVIRDLGDWSGRLAQTLSLGDSVLVEGPYGRLELLPATDDRPVLWIAGGVGVTPFLAAATASSSARSHRPQMIFCVRSRDDAPGLETLERAADEGRIELHVFASAEGRRLSAEALDEVIADVSIAEAHVVMCGPTALVRDMRAALVARGVPHVHVEGFDIRTGIGPDLSRQVDQLLWRWFPSMTSKQNDEEPESDEAPATAGVRSGAKGN